MFPTLRHFRPLTLLIAVICLAGPAQAAGGWMGFRNDTTGTLVVQETVSVGTGNRPGKPQKIFANETVRETPPAGGQRTFTIADPAKPDKPLFTGRFASPAENENVLYAIKSDGKGGLTVEAITSAASVSKYPPKR